MAALTRGTLRASTAAPADGERFEQLARLGAVRIEQILSSDRPEAIDYDQADDEWVVLLEGHAELAFSGERVQLAPGDWLVIPARTRHRVAAVTAGARWLAVHVPPVAPVATGHR